MAPRIRRGWRAGLIRAGPWLLASYVLGIVTSAGAADGGLVFDGVGAIIALGCWMVGLHRWAGPRPRDRVPSRTGMALLGWFGWMLAWVALVLGLIGGGFALRHVLTPAYERAFLLAGGLMGFSALGIWGTTAALNGRNPFRRQLTHQNAVALGWWVGLWLILTVGDGLTLALLALTVPRGAATAAVGDAVGLVWSVVETTMLVAASQKAYKAYDNTQQRIRRKARRQWADEVTG